jgi:hypothetical protein
MKKWVIASLFIFLGSTVLFSQDLVEAAKKEKERRESLKKPSSVVVTNSDLKKVEKEEAIVIVSSQSAARRSQDTVSPQAALPQTSRPAPQKTNLDQMSQIDMHGYDQAFAQNVLNFNELVRNPQRALNKPLSMRGEQARKK